MKTKEMKGITLVALVITIVVLLILAGVSINTVLGDDGIIKKAKEAAEATRRASAEEEMNRLVLEYQLASNDETLESFLQEKVTEGRIDGVTDNGDGTITITKKVEGKDYTITVNQFKNSILEDINIKIGDSVNYTYDSAGSYSLSSTYSGYSSNQTISQTKGLTWKVLNVDKENDTVDIISANTTSSQVEFYGILGYNNGPYLMNEICKAQYSNKALGVNARSINLLDMEKQLTAAGIKSRNEYNKGSSTYAQYGTTKTYTSNTKYPSLYANQKGAGPNITAANASTISQPNISKDNFIPDPYEESKPIVPKDTTEPTTSSTYGTGSPLTVTQTFYSIAIDNTNYGTASSILANDSQFWVAARYVNADWTVACFGLRCADTDVYGRYIFSSNGDTYSYYSALRPVVSLPSSLLTGEQTNGAWNLSK